MYGDNRQLAIRRAAWGGLFAALATLAYYLAYALVVWQTVRGDFSIGDLAFLTGSFLRLRSLLEGQQFPDDDIAVGAQIFSSWLVLSGTSESSPVNAAISPVWFTILSPQRYSRERDYLLRALEASGKKRTRAADMLGISRKTLWEKLRAHELQDGQETVQETESESGA